MEVIRIKNIFEMMFLNQIALLIFSIGHVTCWINELDQAFTFTCPSDTSLYHVVSSHNNHAEDRVWDFSCRSPPHHEAKMTNCEWSSKIANVFCITILNFYCSGPILNVDFIYKQWLRLICALRTFCGTARTSFPQLGYRE